MAFFKFRSRGPQANEGRNTSAAALPAESVESMRRRARRKHGVLGALHDGDRGPAQAGEETDQQGHDEAEHARRGGSAGEGRNAAGASVRAEVRRRTGGPRGA